MLQKSDLLMSLLDLKWNDIQPELQKLVRDINASRPFAFTRDDVLKSLLLAEGAETRFDKLVSDRKQVEQLALRLPIYIGSVKRAWELLGCILMDNCRIYSERFFRGGHNALLTSACRWWRCAARTWTALFVQSGHSCFAATGPANLSPDHGRCVVAYRARPCVH